MGMLDVNDLKQIGELMDAKFIKFEDRMDANMDAKFVKFEDRIVDRVVGEVGVMLEENVLPNFDRLENTLVTKDYLDEKLGNVNGKMNVLVDVLQRNGTISGDQRGIVHAAS